LRNYLLFIRIHSRAFGIALIFSIFVASLFFFIYISLKQWKEEVVQTNMVLCDVLAEQLTLSAGEVVAELDAQNLFNITDLAANQHTIIDNRLKEISGALFSRTKGIEGGFFLTAYDEFFGYAYPTSPPPKPVYGPPPRSYNIIKEQVLKTVATDSALTFLHQFDPAIFPLSTRPVKVRGKSVGAVWARIHIERELPYLKLRQIINMGFIIALIGFAVAGFSSLNVRKKIQRLSSDLDAIQQGTASEVRPASGNLEYVSKSINRMVAALNTEYKKREKLERELSQKAKMASLGRLVAGVAHEIKTPLAIIKTRIQMWQQDMKKSSTATLPGSLTPDSMQMIVNETNRLDELLKRLLYFARPISPTLQPVKINDILTHTLLFIRTSSGPDAIHFIDDFENGLPLIQADPNSLEQVFINIIMNAIEACEPKDTITVKTRLDRKNKSVQICVEDTGKGINEEQSLKIFDPFFTTKNKGFGLGLSISYEIISAHQGTIRFMENQPRGSVCLIDIPIANKQKH
jgi:signal transduction histidine kinase